MSEVYSSDDDSSATALTRAWAERVAANREQAERLREESDGGDHYRPLASAFRADPRRTGDSALEALLAIASPNDTWLDIGAGAGRFALPLALHVKRVVAIEPSPAMRAELANLQIEHGITNVDLRDQRWPSDDPTLSDIADVALISHVGYDIEQIGAFLDTMQRAARRECVALQFDHAPGSMFWQIWPAIHDEEHARLPGALDFIELLKARGASVDAGELERRGDRQRFVFDSVDDAMDWARRRLWLAEDSAKMPLLRDALGGLLVEVDGGWSLPDQPTQMLIRWRQS
ncbi:MAG: methyltransferase domain-containing protein [Chloroflexi bacterium]|nr:methyltransferase domain-containing protein [Chloroflexota bacterium]MCY3696182.1 methyltransferase domain-containing protein [Chloroflexota bacterium]